MPQQTTHLVDLPKIPDERGNLSFIEEETHIPFKIRRTYWMYDVPGGAAQEGYAHSSSQEFIVALSGSFDVVLYDGTKEYHYHLNRSHYGLYVPEMIWRTISNFSTNSLALILSDQTYDEKDHIRDYERFKEMTNV